MKLRSDLETNVDAINRILATEEELIPSSGFLAAAMERVRDAAAMPAPIPFPWMRALPGIVLAAAVLGWLGFELVQTCLAAAPKPAVLQMQLTAATVRALEPAGWVTLALVVTMLSWLLARRLAGRSGLL